MKTLYISATLDFLIKKKIAPDFFKMALSTGSLVDVMNSVAIKSNLKISNTIPATSYNELIKLLNKKVLVIEFGAFTNIDNKIIDISTGKIYSAETLFKKLASNKFEWTVISK